MTKRMLIDSTHAEETRVVVLDGNRLEDYDVETSTKQQLKGNIYLAKIVRVEPSLQAAFVEFGGGRHGFLAFGEIHPDYYQIPVADRKRLLELQEAEAREEEEEEEREALRHERGGPAPRQPKPREDDDIAEAEAEDPALDNDDAGSGAGDVSDADTGPTALIEAGLTEPSEPHEPTYAHPEPANSIAASITQDIIVAPEAAAEPIPHAPDPNHDEPVSEGAELAPEANEPATAEPAQAETTAHDAHAHSDQAEPPAAQDPDHDDTRADPEISVENGTEPQSVETIIPVEQPENIGGELETDERQDRRPPSRFIRNYKIQEVMRRRQILLVQVVKEERGSKGAALTTYISLAGRFSVLMPNSPRGGGISRKITSAADRRRLKEITTELDLPRGMGLIVRTAGAQRPKAEIIRDCEYLLNQWDQIRDLTMKSMAPTLIYEEASLIKRAIRDVYSREVEEILVDGEAGWTAAHDFMRMLMPSHARKVQLWRDPQPLFAKAQVESQLDAMLQPTVQLRSGGYLVINQTEALVAIDVNSGRSTRERGIEETAVRTNLEAAEEAARQLRLRDLAGLIVIDFIDMESRRNNTAVEKRLKDALKNDRARIQVGSISHFGLLEMSRQRLRPSLTETSFVTCTHCGGSGHMRSTESAALAVLRGIEDEGSKRRAAEIIVHVHGSIAFYILNHKRVRLAEIEERFGMHVTFQPDDAMIPPGMRIEQVRALLASEGPVPISQLPPPEPFDDPDEEVMETEPVEAEIVELPPAPPQAARNGRRDGRRDNRRDAPRAATTQETDAPTTETEAVLAAAEPSIPAGDDDEADRPGETPEEGEQRRGKRRRRRRGGRRDGVANPASAEAGATGAPDQPSDLTSSTPDAPGEDDGEASEAAAADLSGEAPVTEASADAERKRRGRRGGRRRRRDPVTEGEIQPKFAPDASQEPHQEPEQEPEPVRTQQPVTQYIGPTPANPFGGDSNAFAFFDAVEEVEDRPRIPTPSPAMAETHPEPAGFSPESTPAPQPAPDPAEGPALEPAALAIEGPPAEKKRGWWRR